MYVCGILFVCLLFLRLECISKGIYVYNNCKQTNNQIFYDCVTERWQRVSKCEFGDLCDSLIKDILVIGFKDLRLTERLFREPDLTIRKSIYVGQAAEETKRQAKELATSEIPEMYIF